MRSMRYICLLLVTIFVLLGTWLALRREWGKRSVIEYHRYRDERRSPEFWQKFYLVLSLAEIGKKRAFTEKEMEILRQIVCDESPKLRVEALYALSWANYDPQQRQEAIQLAVERLNDPNWLVRVFALDVLRRLNARSSIHKILPLLNDPTPEVRQVAKQTLKKLGYTLK